MEIDPTQSEALRQKSETLRTLSNGPISSSISKLSGSSRVLPSEKDFHFYYNFDEFKAPIDEISAKSQSMLQQIGSSKHLWSGKEMGFPMEVDEDAYDWLVNVNDEVIERFDVSMDEFSRLRKEEEEGAKAGPVIDENGFQLVSGKKKKVPSVGGMREKEEVVASPTVRVAERDKKTVGPKPKVPFHIPTIKRPQEEYNILVNNSSQPFQHVWLERSEDGSRFVHPLEKVLVSDFVDHNIASLEPMKPPPLESTPFKMVEEVKDLKELAAKLRTVNEFAVDLEHNQYRSFQGLTCLMQISTITEDFVVDTLKLRIHIGPYLREIFKDPAKKKVMHGADRDIAWLQRDFGIYVCNLFDTGQASRVLQLERNSLEYLLQYFCEVTANKEYQNADWRLRPLPAEMIKYAREDTHYLLYIYDLMRIRLHSESTDPENSDALLLEVYRRSYDLCMQLYEKELLTDTSYLYIYGVQASNLNAQQLSIVAGLCEWRDMIARSEDESTGYILPNKVLLEIAKQMPLTTGKLRRLVRSKHPYVERNLSSVVSIIRHSVQNASSFEAVAEQLKEGRIQAPEITTTGDDFPEVHTAGDYNGEGSDVSHDSHLTKEGGEVSFGGIVQNGNIRKDFAFFSQKNEINASAMHSEKVAEATVPVLKRPNRAFGALLGSSASKKKIDFRKDNRDEKLEQIKSSLNLPFYSFLRRDQQSVQFPDRKPEEQRRASPSLNPPALSATTSEDIILLDSDQKSNLAPEHPENSEIAPTSSNIHADSIILLDSDSDDAEPPLEGSTGNESRDDRKEEDGHATPDQPELVVLDEDEDEDDNDNDEPMSLSDLSSNFQKCLKTNNQEQKSEGTSGGVGFKPFDYEAAKKEVKFGEFGRKEGKTGEKQDGGKNFGKKKKGGSDKKSKQDEDGLLPQGKRRQAFPASGNRSATFR